MEETVLRICACQQVGKDMVSRSVLVTPNGNEHEYVYRIADWHDKEALNVTDAHLLVHFQAAMRIGRRFRVEAAVDEQLLINMDLLQGYWHHWFPDRLVPVDIVPRSVHKSCDAPEPSNRIISCFSGGVDSLHTLLRASQDLRAPHGSILFLNGFDITTGEEETYEKARDLYLKLAAEKSVSLLQVHSPARQYARAFDMSWGRMAHGPVLAGAMKLFSPSHGIACIPSSHSPDSLPSPWGSNPVTDPLYSTACQRVVHHGFPLTRFDKLVEIAGCPELIPHLRVCWENLRETMNCGKCRKCLLTMLALHLADSNSRAAAFPHVSVQQALDLFPTMKFNRYQLEQVRIIHHEAALAGERDIRQAADQVLNQQLLNRKTLGQRLKSIKYKTRAQGY